MMTLRATSIGIGEHGPGSAGDWGRPGPAMLVLVEQRDPDVGALASVAWLAKRLGARTVMAALATREASFDELDRFRIQLARKAVHRAARALIREGIQTEERVTVSGPHERTLGSARDLVETVDPALVCVLACRRSRLRILPGSPVAHYLQRVGTRPVVVLGARRPHRSGGAAERWPAA